MRRYLTIVALCALTLILSAPSYAQCAPGIVNPLQAVQGNWGFRLEGFSVLPGTAFGFVGAIGKFTATMGNGGRSNVLQGLLVGTMTAANLNGTVGPLNAAINGNFQVDADCNSGNLSFGNGILPPGFRTVQFVMVNGGTQMYLVTADNNGIILVGEAKKM